MLSSCQSLTNSASARPPARPPSLPSSLLLPSLPPFSLPSSLPPSPSLVRAHTLQGKHHCGAAGSGLRGRENEGLLRYRQREAEHARHSRGRVSGQAASDLQDGPASQVCLWFRHSKLKIKFVSRVRALGLGGKPAGLGGKPASCNQSPFPAYQIVWLEGTLWVDVVF